MTPDRERSDKTLAKAEGSPSNSPAGPCDTPQQHISQSYTHNFTNCLGRTRLAGYCSAGKFQNKVPSMAFSRGMGMHSAAQQAERLKPCAASHLCTAPRSL